MYELILKDIFPIDKVVKFLNENKKVSVLKNNFGILEVSNKFDKLNEISGKAKVYNIKTIIKEYKKIDIQKYNAYTLLVEDEWLVINESIKIYINEIKAVVLNFIKKHLISFSTRFFSNHNEFYHYDIYPQLLLYTDKIIVIDEETDFLNKSIRFKNGISIMEKFLNFIDFIYIVNPKVIKSPSLKIYKENNNYVKYFIKEFFCENEDEIIWMIKTKLINI